MSWFIFGEEERGVFDVSTVSMDVSVEGFQPKVVSVAHVFTARNGPEDLALRD